MEKLGDDALGSILKWVTDGISRKECSKVSKQWARVEGLTRESIRIIGPDHFHHFLLRFPYLLSLKTDQKLLDSDLKFIAKTCPCLQTLNLSARRVVGDYEGCDETDDFGDEGMCAIVYGCPNLTQVSLRRRRRIRDVSVVAMTFSIRNLAFLDLSWCDMITDRALEAIGLMSSLTTLLLRGCSLITDGGLFDLSSGPLSRTLKNLDLSECDQITDAGGIGISAISSLRRLNLSCLVNLSDDTLFAVGSNCRNLLEINVTSCEMISGRGIRSFASHKSLEILWLAFCYDVRVSDILHTLSECRSLRFLGLAETLIWWMTSDTLEELTTKCRIHWM